MSQDHPSNWQDALVLLDLETLRLILLLVKEHYELTGEFLTATQLRAMMQQPGS